MEEKISATLSTQPDKPASDHLRDLIKSLSEAEVTYKELAESIGGDWGWTGAAIKQLASRWGHNIRADAKNTALVDTVKKCVRRQYKGSSRLSELMPALKAVDELRIQNFEPSKRDLDALTTYIGTRFQKIRRTSSQFEWPRRSAFARWDWERRRLVTILIETLVGERGVVFVMKISGTTSRRIVIGDVLTTARNTYFSGLAYELATDVDDDEFASINAFDVEELLSYTGPNEIGLECFTVSNSFLHQRTCSVTFQGLDGRGNPISGLGKFIKVPEFSKLNIAVDAPSTAECSKENLQLRDALVSSGGITVGPSTIDTFSIDADFQPHSVACIGTVDLKPGAESIHPEGWAFLRRKSETQVDVLYSQAQPKGRTSE